MRAGEGQIERACHQRGERGELLGWPVERRPLAGGEPHAGDAEHQAHDDADMQPGHRKQMRQARTLEREPVGRRDGRADAGQQRRRDGAIFAWKGGEDARSDAGADGQ